jgi:hypothetical protein
MVGLVRSSHVAICLSYCCCRREHSRTPSSACSSWIAPSGEPRKIYEYGQIKWVGEISCINLQKLKKICQIWTSTKGIWNFEWGRSPTEIHLGPPLLATPASLTPPKDTRRFCMAHACNITSPVGQPTDGRPCAIRAHNKHNNFFVCLVEVLHLHMCQKYQCIHMNPSLSSPNHMKGIVHVFRKTASTRTPKIYSMPGLK